MKQFKKIRSAIIVALAGLGIAYGVRAEVIPFDPDSTPTVKIEERYDWQQTPYAPIHYCSDHYWFYNRNDDGFMDDVVIRLSEEGRGKNLANPDAVYRIRGLSEHDLEHDLPRPHQDRHLYAKCLAHNLCVRCSK